MEKGEGNGETGGGERELEKGGWGGGGLLFVSINICDIYVEAYGEERWGVGGGGGGWLIVV